MEENINYFTTNGMGNIMNKQWFKNGNVNACSVNIWTGADFPVLASCKEQGHALSKDVTVDGAEMRVTPSFPCLTWPHSLPGVRNLHSAGAQSVRVRVCMGLCLRNNYWLYTYKSRQLPTIVFCSFLGKSCVQELCSLIKSGWSLNWFRICWFNWLH